MPSDLNPVNPNAKGGGFQIPLSLEGKSGSWGSSSRGLKVNEVKDQKTGIKTPGWISKIHCCNVFSNYKTISNTTEEGWVQKSIKRPPDLS